MTHFLNRLKAFLFRRQRDKDLQDEMAAHLDMDAQERIDEGDPPEEARRSARRDLGSPVRIAEDTRAAWGWTLLEELWQDLGYGVRVLRRSPAFTLGAVAVLALGIGVNLAEYQIFDAMVFHRITIRDADSFVQLSYASPQGPRLAFPSGATETYRARSKSFAWLASEDTTFDVTVDGESGAHSNLVSTNYFGSLGIVPEQGRLFDPGDDQSTAPAVAVLSYPYWQARWAADPKVIGTVIHINNTPVQVVGILPSNFEGLTPRPTQVWLPLALRPRLIAGSLPIRDDFSRTSQMLYANLKPGVSLAAAEAELDSITRSLVEREPRYAAAGIHGQFVQASMIRRVWMSAPFAIFVVMVVLVLVSACANLGNMLLAQGLARQHEIGIRKSIGASPNRMVRQLITESFLLATLGTIAGLVFGAITARALLNAMGAGPEIHLAVRWPIFAAGVLLIFISTAAFGLPAALQTVQLNRKKIHLRQGLIGVQIAVSCLLLIASSVLAHNGILSSSIDLAFDYKNMIVVSPQLYGRDLPESVALQKLDELASRLRDLPDVDGVTAAVSVPLSGRSTFESLPGQPRIYLNSVQPSYFTVLNLPFLRGRAFLAGELNTVVVSESAARAVWPNQDPLGKTWNLAGAERTIVGVTKDSGANLFADADSVEAYLPVQNTDAQRTVLIVHTRRDAAAAARTILASGAALDETISVSLMRASRDNFLNGQRRTITLIGSIGAVATALAAVGMFALVAFTVAQRKKELGIRVAIGAAPHHVLRVLVAENLRPTALGILAGAGLAIVLTRLVRSLIVLQNHGAIDFAGFGVGIACFLLVAVLASLSPAIRALRIDPFETLRQR